MGPYCGTAPLPDEIWTRWNLDPFLIAALAGSALLYEIGLRRVLHQAPAAARQHLAAARAFYCGWALVVIAFVSPLCSLSVALFSARIGQHMLLLLVAAPLILLGRPGAMLAPLLGSGHSVALRALRRRVSALAGVPFAWAAFAVLLWLWHVPAAYVSTFESTWAFWVMHLTLFGSALLLWRVLLPNGPDRDVLPKMLAGFTTLLHMSVLGALITFAPTVLYWPHVLTTHAWGLRPLEDQQLGGLIMWVPGASGFLAAALASAALALRQRASS